MKKKVGIILMISFFMFFIFLINTDASVVHVFDQIDNNIQGCQEIFGADTMELLRTIISIMRWAVPIVIIALSAVDFSKVIVMGNPGPELSKATKTTLTRVVIGVIIFFIPTLLNLILYLIDSSTCGL